MSATAVGEIVIGTVAIVGGMLFAVWDTRRHRSAGKRPRSGTEYAREMWVRGSARGATQHKSELARELLNILLAEQGPIPRKQLIELLWPDTDPAVARNRLSVLLSTVHHALQPQGRAGLPASDGIVVWLDRT